MRLTKIKPRRNQTKRNETFCDFLTSFKSFFFGRSLFYLPGSLSLSLCVCVLIYIAWLNLGQQQLFLLTLMPAETNSSNNYVAMSIHTRGTVGFSFGVLSGFSTCEMVVSLARKWTWFLSSPMSTALPIPLNYNITPTQCVLISSGFHLVASTSSTSTFSKCSPVPGLTLFLCHDFRFVSLR